MKIFELFMALLPVYAIFLLGILLRWAKILTKDDAALLLKLIFYICLPAMISLAVVEIRLSRELLVLPIIPLCIVPIMSALSLLTFRIVSLETRTKGTFFVGVMIMNLGFIYPIAQSIYGNNGVSQVAMYDVGHGFLAFSVAYALACRYGGEGGTLREILGRVLKSPPLWAILIGIGCNLAHIPLPSPLKMTVKLLGDAATPLIMLSMGIFFTPRLVRLVVLAPAIFIRMVIGSLLGLLFAELFGVEGVTRIIVVICSAAPAGHSTLTFSALKHLDTEFAASLVPISAVCAIVYLPLLIAILQ